MGTRNGKGQFKKGHGTTANRKGRPPRHLAIAQIVRDFMSQPYDKRCKDKTRLLAVIEKHFKLAMEGRVESLRIILAYGWGKPPEHVTQDGEHRIVYERRAPDMDPATLAGTRASVSGAVSRMPGLYGADSETDGEDDPGD
jgi:hypothetical protein